MCSYDWSELKNIVFGLDIGTTKIVCLAGKLNEHGKLEVVEYFMKGVVKNTEPKSIDQSRPIHLAASNGHLDTVIFLMANIQNKEPKDEEDNTPLHKSAMNGHFQTV